ncbi:glycosyltransferase family 4 protein [Flavobacterium psychrophilum]|uniref:glycosyltransferase family 4 protein n=1 Tax=Flavobacterium psychrophilum TaxID=96345 RepID=UPI000B7C51F2|nr:glycosyltransferase family 4 protein [Flavobacterium psychrophilum]EKT3965389.1 glycosyltransferase family 4 protein [Flavobacterium psychrophilum]MCB6087623.1 glycosyltransferase family 4 protein [Flavobacterium psychrophilum]SNB38318.1 Glycosyl transferase, group 4 family protein [Flavobacterium psychrophilum]
MKIKENQNNKKKIVFKISEFPHVSETFIIAQIITAIQLNYAVVILVNKALDFEQSLHEDLLLKYKLNEFIVLEDVKIPKNKIIKCFKIFYLFILNLSHLKNMLNFYKFQKEKSFSWIFYWIFYKQFDDSNTIFHIQYGNNKFPIDVLKAKCNFKAKVITTFHGHDAFFPMQGFIPNDGYYDLLFESADIITANTPYLADKIKKLNCPPEKLKIIPVGVDTNFFNVLDRVQKSKSILKLINVGRLDPVKGQKYLIQIVNQILEKGINVHLDIVGEGAERNNLEQIIRKYNLAESIKLVGEKSESEIKEMYLKSDLYLFAAVPLPNGRRETQGLATLEAQACGLPVIAYNSGGVKYTIKDNVTGFLFDEFEIEKVVKKLLFLNENRAVIYEMSNNCYKFVAKNYSQKVIKEKWFSIYSNL